jgi:hypothetical protein
MHIHICVYVCCWRCREIGTFGRKGKWYVAAMENNMEVTENIKNRIPICSNVFITKFYFYRRFTSSCMKLWNVPFTQFLNSNILQNYTIILQPG